MPDSSGTSFRPKGFNPLAIFLSNVTSSSVKSWFPAMVSFKGASMPLRMLIVVRNSFNLERLVRSPQWMATSARISARFKSMPCVSDMIRRRVFTAAVSMLDVSLWERWKGRDVDRR